MSFARPQTQPQPSVATASTSPRTAHHGMHPQIMGVPPPVVPQNAQISQQQMPPPPVQPQQQQPPQQSQQPHQVLQQQQMPQMQQLQQLQQQRAPHPPQSQLSGAQVTPRFVDLLEQIRTEFIAISTEASRVMLYKDETDSKLIHQHMNDLTQIRKTIYELDQAHRQMRERYEEEVNRLRAKLDQLQPQPSVPMRADGPDPSLPASLAGSAKGAAELPAPTPKDLPSEGLNGQAQSASLTSAGLTAAFNPPRPQPSLQQLQQHQQQHVAPPAAVSAAPAPVHSGIPGPVTPLTVGESGESVGSLVVGGDSTGTANGESKGEMAGTNGSAEQLEEGLNFASLDLAQLAPEFRKEAADYSIVFNPEIPKRLDVELVRSLKHQSVVCCVRFSADGKYLASGCNRSAQIYDVESGELVTRLQDPNVDGSVDLYIRSVCFSPDGKYLATGAEDHKVRIWDIERGSIKSVLQGHTQDIYSLLYSSTGKFVVSGSGDRFVKIWDVESGKCQREFCMDDGVTAVALSPDDRYVATGSLDRAVRVWDLTTGELIEKLVEHDGHMDSVYSVVYRPDGKELVSGSLDRTLKVWQLGERGEKNNGVVRKTIYGHNDYVLSVAMTPDSKWILSGSKDRSVQMWDAGTGVVQLMLQSHDNSVISVAPSSQGNVFASGGGDFTAKLWKYHQI